MVRAHLKYLTVHIYLTQIEESTFKDARIKPILLDLANIYLLS